MKKLLLLALIPLIGINRLQASFKDFYDRLMSYASPVQTAVVAASVVTLHGVGYLCGLKARKWYEVKKANQPKPTVVQEQPFKVPELTQDQKNKLNQLLTLSPEARQQLDRSMAYVEKLNQKKAMAHLLESLALGFNDDYDEDTKEYLIANGWSWKFDPKSQKYEVFDAQKNYYDYEIKPNKSVLIKLGDELSYKKQQVMNKDSLSRNRLIHYPQVQQGIVIRSLKPAIDSFSQTEQEEIKAMPLRIYPTNPTLIFHRKDMMHEKGGLKDLVN